jgi:hypothetical protein
MLVASSHCGAVRVEIARKPERLTDCNCSICRRYGALWAYAARKVLRVDAAPDALVTYSWSDRELEFVHCRTCGCVVFWQAAGAQDDDARAAVNARMLDPADIAARGSAGSTAPRPGSTWTSPMTPRREPPMLLREFRALSGAAPTARAARASA